MTFKAFQAPLPELDRLNGEVQNYISDVEAKGREVMDASFHVERRDVQEDGGVRQEAYAIVAVWSGRPHATTVHASA